MFVYEQELKKACDLLCSEKWNVQNNKADNETNFIYYINTIDLVKQLSEINDCDFGYALHRWYNFHTSIQVENILCELGAIKEENLKHHDIDIYIKDVPFDIKLSVLPNKFIKFNYRNRENKNDLIKWFIENASNEKRSQTCNRLFVVCKANTYKERLTLKSDYEKIFSACQKFMDFYKNKEFNKIIINEKEIFCDIIVVENY